MTCANCAANIERAVGKKLPGVVQASVNFATEKLSVEHIPSIVNVDDIAAAVEKAGYGMIIPEDQEAGEDLESAARQAEIKEQTRKFSIGLLFALPLFLLSMARDFSLVGPWSHALWVNWLFFAPGDTGPVLYRMGLLHRRDQEPAQWQRQYGCPGGHGILRRLLLLYCGPCWFPI